MGRQKYEIIYPDNSHEDIKNFEEILKIAIIKTLLDKGYVNRLQFDNWLIKNIYRRS